MQPHSSPCTPPPLRQLRTSTVLSTAVHDACAHASASRAPISLLQVEALTQKVAEMSYAAEDVEALAYSPDGARLAAGSHDNFIDIFDVGRGCGR